MYRKTVLWLEFILGTLLSSSPPSFACFADPDAKPTSEFSSVRLSARPHPAAVYTEGDSAFYLEPEALYDYFKTVNRGQSVARRYDLENGVRLHTPFKEDFSLNEMIDSLIPERLREDPKAVAKLRTRGRSKLRSTVGALLEAGQGAVIHKGKEISTVVIENHSGICWGEKSFRVPGGDVVLSYRTGIS